MDTGTGQPLAAPENVDLQNAADAFKAILTEDKNQPRDEHGRFASNGQEEPVEETEAVEAEAEQAEVAADDGTGQDADEAAEEAQPEDDVPMPVSWAKEDEALWNELPAPAKAKIFAREAQRDQAVNLKFQEAANARKQAEAFAYEAANNRDRLVNELKALEAAYQPLPPDPSMLRPNSPNYDPDTYHLMRAEYEQAAQYIATVKQQRDALEAENRAQLQYAEAEQFMAVEQEWRPRLFAAVPELNDPQKAPTVLAELNAFGLSAGYDHERLSQATSQEILILWKAAQFDKQQAAAQRVKAQARPQPKPASPAIRPGVSTPAALVRQSERAKVMERLSKSGSLEDGAAAFKLFAKGK